MSLAGPEWDWLAQQAVELGIPLARHVRNVLTITAPAAQDPENFLAFKNALFEARTAINGLVVEAVESAWAKFKRDPMSFLPAQYRANPAVLASNPAWEEPSEPGAKR